MSTTKLLYASATALTIDLASLASDTNLLAGRESTAFDNSTNRYLDALVSGQFTVGASGLTADRVIEVWAYGSLNDSPLYPDVFDGTDSNETITSANVKSGVLRPVFAIPTDSTGSRVYHFGPISLAASFGGVLPPYFGLFVVHNTGAALAASGHNLWVKPVHLEVV